ncbi:uncharacterized protein LOC144704306 isoform X2 [Wolffia australiana]
MEGDSAVILREISMLKNMIDQVNEEIEENIQRTRHMESELLRYSEIEKVCQMREENLLKMVAGDEFELNNVLTVSEFKDELNAMKLRIQNMLKNIEEKREKFIAKCQKFQREIMSGDSAELCELLSVIDSLENEQQNLCSKVNLLKDSTAEFVEELLREIHSATVALEVRIKLTSSENTKVSQHIEDLKHLICSLI